MEVLLFMSRNRKQLSKNQSKRSFRSGSGVHIKNLAYRPVMRGGIRL